MPALRHAQYNFDGFYLDSAMEGEAMTSMPIFIEGDKVVYTKWTNKVEYNLNGGTGTPLPSADFLYGTKDIVLSPVPADWTREGYEPCLGWSTDAKATGAMVSRQGGAAANLPLNKTITLYAVWLPKTSRVVLTTGGAATGGIHTDNLGTVTAAYGSEMPDLTDINIPSRDGYIFAGYFDAMEGGVQYYTSSGVSARKWNKTANEVVLYAQWRTARADNLNGLLVSNGTLRPSFSPNVYDYKLTLPCSDVALTIGYPAGNKVYVNDEQATTTYVIPANPTYNMLQIQVTSAGKVSVNYTIRLDAPLSNSNIVYNPAVAPRSMEVSDNVANAYSHYQWYEGDAAIAGAESAVLFSPAGFKTDAVYSVIAYADNGDTVRVCGIAGAASSGSGETEQALEAFPNPVGEMVNVVHPALGREAGIIRIFTTSGALVLSYPVEADGKNAVSINISALAAGMYVVKVFNSSTTIIKQ
jgi:hypothetical protein